MYAYTSNGFRQIENADEAIPGETVADDVPDTVLKAIRSIDSRIQRDAMLRACDWTQVADAPLDTVQKAQWATYRQALRAVPSQAGFPDAIQWPTPPTLPTGAAITGSIS